MHHGPQPDGRMHQVSQPVDAVLMPVPVADGRHADNLPVQQFNALFFRQDAGRPQGQILVHGEPTAGAQDVALAGRHDASRNHRVPFGGGKATN